MRAIVTVIALVFAVGAVMPVEADARSPRRIEQWGCIFVAKVIGTVDTVPEGPFPIYGLGSIKCPGGRRPLAVTVSVLQDVPGGPNLLLRRNRYVRSYGPLEQWEDTDYITCVPGAPPPPDPYFMRMRVKRKGLPGAVVVATRNRANPCGPFGHGPMP